MCVLQKCDSANFCKRNRGLKGTAYAINPSSINENDIGAFSAVVTNQAGGAQFKIGVHCIEGGIVRVLVDEAANTDRYRVKDILMPDLEQKHRRWSSVQRSGGGYTLSQGDTSVHIALQPFRLDVEVHGTQALKLNSRDMFNFEQRRSKGEEDPAGWWEESFGGKTDSKPHGPEALTLDIALPGQRAAPCRLLESTVMIAGRSSVASGWIECWALGVSSPCLRSVQVSACLV